MTLIYNSILATKVKLAYDEEFYISVNIQKTVDVLN
ncbi:unnamed protein product, partial [marine sediment metagenome]